MYWYWDATYILVIIGAAISVIASRNVNRTFKNFSRFSNGKGLAAEDVAALIMHGAGIHDVRIKHIRGNLTDHYSPQKRFCDYLIACMVQHRLQPWV